MTTRRAATLQLVLRQWVTISRNEATNPISYLSLLEGPINRKEEECVLRAKLTAEGLYIQSMA